MQSSDYIEKYKNFFQSPEIDSIISTKLQLSGLQSINDKYALTRKSQINERVEKFNDAFKKAIDNDDSSFIGDFTDEIVEIGKRNAAVAKTLTQNYLETLSASNRFINKPQVILDILCDMSGCISEASCLKLCVDSYIEFINKFDDLNAENIGDVFYDCVARIAPQNAWVRFRRFRLGLGCHKNRDFTNLNETNYKKSREGASIYADSDEQLKGLFNQQASNFTKRKDREQKEQQAIELAEKTRRESEEAVRKAQIEKNRSERQRKIARRQARVARAKAGTQWCAFLLPAILLIIVVIVALIKPTLIFGAIHFAWIICGCIVAPLFIGIVSIICYKYGGVLQYAAKRLAFVIVINAICLILMIICMASIPYSTIEIGSVKDFNAAIKNMPTAKCYVLIDDVDFKDTEFVPIKILKSECTIDGRGHTISNIIFSTCVDVSNEMRGTSGDKRYYWYGSGLVACCQGTIKDLNFRNIEIAINQQSEHGNGYDRLAVGAIAGFNCGGTIQNCQVINYREDLSLAIDFDASESGSQYYGICGWNYSYMRGVIDNCKLLDSSEIEEDGNVSDDNVSDNNNNQGANDIDISDTIMISSVSEFQTIMYGALTKKTYILESDLDFEGVDFTPIMRLPSGVTLDGNGHKIKNIYTTQAVDITGLQNFGNTAHIVTGLIADCEGIIKNLSLESCSFITEYTYTGGLYYSDFCGGGIAGVLFGGTISDCKVSNSTFDFSNVKGVRSFKDTTTFGMSGLCGFNFTYKKGKITNCEVINCVIV